MSYPDFFNPLDEIIFAVINGRLKVTLLGDIKMVISDPNSVGSDEDVNCFTFYGLN